VGGEPGDARNDTLLDLTDYLAPLQRKFRPILQLRAMRVTSSDFWYSFCKRSCGFVTFPHLHSLTCRMLALSPSIHFHRFRPHGHQFTIHRA
jgi:hypothetical protein